jgi:CRISPR-associated endonuclease Csn1
MSMKLTALAKILKLRSGERFTLDSGVRDAIACDPVRASLSHPDRFGPRWSSLSWEAQWNVIGQIRAVQSDGDHEALVSWLVDAHQLDKDRAVAVANAPLPEGYGRLGLTATQRVLDQLHGDVLTYSEAVAACGWHHSDHRTGECFDRLPYYGEVLERHVIPGSYDENDDEIARYGRVTNPTVHIGLNQLRRLLNRIIDTHGKPDQIVVELARELKQSEEQKRKAMKRIRDTTADAQRRSKQLEELGQPDTGQNRMLLRLWEDLGPAIGPRCCPYTGNTISCVL